MRCVYFHPLLFALLATAFYPSNAEVCTAGQQPHPDYTYVGCYKDVCCGDDSEYPDYLNFLQNTIETCMATARSNNKKYAALSFGRNCKGGDTYGKYGLADPSECNDPCEANPSQNCGGIPEQSVYELYYVPINGTRECVGCGSGTYSSNGTKCEPAPKGTYVPNTNSSAYITCTRGTYQNQLGQTSCITCDVKKGQLCPTDNMIDPIIVPAGYFATSSLTTTTTPCSIGTYRALNDDATACIICDVQKGQLCPNPTMIEPMIVPAGYIATSSINTTTTPCPIGTYRSLNDDATKCQPCPGGTYNDKTGQGACNRVPRGTFSPPGSSSFSPCPVGTTTQGQYGLPQCLFCPIGTYSNRTGSIYCDECQLSTQYQDKEGQTQCNPCGQYTFSYKPTKPCQKCGVCKSIYTYLASQELLGNLKIKENGDDWKLLKDASTVGIDISYGKAGVLLQLKKCYNVGEFAIDDLKNPNTQCIAAGAPDQVPDIITPPPSTHTPETPGTPLPGSSGVGHTCSACAALTIGILIVTLVSLVA